MSPRYSQVLRSVRHSQVFCTWTNGTLAELDGTQMVFADGYSLNDAMSALEVWRYTSIHAFRSDSNPRTRLENPAWTAGWFSKKPSARHSTRWSPSYRKKYVGSLTVRSRAR
jgi:hypothetical protein